MQWQRKLLKNHSAGSVSGPYAVQDSSAPASASFQHLSALARSQRFIDPFVRVLPLLLMASIPIASAGGRVSSRVLTRNESGMPPPATLGYEMPRVSLYSCSQSARQPIRPMSVAQGELRPSLRAGRRSGVLARTSISARLNRGGPDVICRVQSGASDELPLSGHACAGNRLHPVSNSRSLGLRGLDGGGL